jgi:hypothetical protein
LIHNETSFIETKNPKHDASGWKKKATKWLFRFFDGVKHHGRKIVVTHRIARRRRVLFLLFHYMFLRRGFRIGRETMKKRNNSEEGRNEREVKNSSFIIQSFFPSDIFITILHDVKLNSCLVSMGRRLKLKGKKGKFEALDGVLW